MKVLLSAVLIMMICFSPMVSNSQTITDSTDAAVGASKIEMSANVTISAMESDKKMLLQPKPNCDPQMLIPATSDNDPKFLLELLS